MKKLRGRLSLLVGGAVVVSIAAVLVYQRLSPVAQSKSEAGKSSIKLPETRPMKPSRRLLEIPVPLVSPRPIGSPDKQNWIEKRVAELDRLAWSDDPESLGKILAELRNSEPEIRAAALAATRDFGSRDAIPHLDDLSRDSKDPLEQKALDDLIDHLRLPTFLEQGPREDPE